MVNKKMVEMAWWKSFEEGGRYLVGVFGVSVQEWSQLGALQRAVVDDFGNLVQVER